MSRIAEAYVQIVPTLSGATKTLEKEFENAGGPSSTSFGNGFKNGLKSLAGPLVAAFSAAAVAKFATDGVKAAQAVSGGLREVVTLTGETGAAADAAFAEFRQGVQGVSRELGISQETLTGGLYQALSAGVPRENAFTFLEVAGKAAIAGVTDTETAVDGLTTVINAWGKDSSDAAKVSDSLFAAVQGGKTTFEELSASLFNVGPAAAAAGVSMEEVNAGIATLTSSGTPTSVATTQLRAALTGLQRPSAELDAIFQDLGYENAQLAIEAEGLGFALGAVKDASGGSNGQLQKLLGSVEAVAAANVIAGTGAEKFSEEMERQNAAAGATDSAFAEIDKSRSLERINIAMENLSITVGNTLLPALEGFVSFATPVFDWLSENPIVVNILIGVLAALAIGFVAVSIATWAMNTALLANPITWIVVGIIALIAAVVLLWQNWDSVVKWISNVWSGLLKALQNGLRQIGTFFSNVWNNIVKFFRDTWTNIRRAAENGWNQIVNFLRSGLAFVVNLFLNWTLLGQIIKNWDAIRNAFTGAWNGIVNWFRSAIGGFVGFWRDSFANVGNFIRDTFRNVVNFVKAPINAIIGLINGMIGSINNIRVDIPDWVPGLGGKSFGFSIPRIPMLATGGNITGAGSVLVGEEGPEILNLPRGAQVVPLDRAGSSGDTNYYVTNPDPAVVVAMLEQRMARRVAF